MQELEELENKVIKRRNIPGDSGEINGASYTEGSFLCKYLGLYKIRLFVINLSPEYVSPSHRCHLQGSFPSKTWRVELPE